ncbi:MAG: hypothetical protein CMM86_13450 [Rhodovulum sp.]|nr:hypothetical protein [Rhodovulum sp.]|tara:strand:- start:305 stop:535 length:231 start_codon:yes stop_codon:yes gene_type:complete
MKYQSHDKMEIEGQGNTQACSGLQRSVAKHEAHNPARKNYAAKPEHYQLQIPCSDANSCGLTAARGDDHLCLKEVE